MSIMADDNSKQIDRFREAARQLECDDDEAKFAAALKKVAKAKPPKGDKPADQE